MTDKGGARMSDPSLEAAQRARAHRIETRPTNDEINAAREALKPIRELHQPSTDGYCCEGCIDHHGNTQPWPCETARLVYSSEELDR